MSIKSMLAAMIAVSLTACASSDEAREYAKITGSHIESVARENKELARQSVNLSAARLANAQEAERDVRLAETLMARIRDGFEKNDGKSGNCDKACLAVFDAIIKSYENEEKLANDSEQTLKLADKRLSDLLKDVSPTVQAASANLEAAGKAAAALAEDMSKTEQIEFLFRYGKQVKKSYDEGRDEAEKTANKESTAKTQGAGNLEKSATETKTVAAESKK